MRFAGYFEMRETQSFPAVCAAGEIETADLAAIHALGQCQPVDGPVVVTQTMNCIMTETLGLSRGGIRQNSLQSTTEIRTSCEFHDPEVQC